MNPAHIYWVNCLLFFSPLKMHQRPISIHLFHINTITIHHITFRISSSSRLNQFSLPSSQSVVGKLKHQELLFSTWSLLPLIWHHWHSFAEYGNQTRKCNLNGLANNASLTARKQLVYSTLDTSLQTSAGSNWIKWCIVPKHIDGHTSRHENNM